MLLRALVVLLVILNLGVAAWWVVRAAPEEVAPIEAGASTLRLVGESAVSEPAPAAPSPTGQADSATADEAATPAVADAPTVDPALRPADPAQCVALGPFADADARQAALLRITPGVIRIVARDVSEAPRGWRVWMAPLADRTAANAMVARLLEAGFNDYYVIADGADANGIALGRFGSEAPARARAQALRAAGFEADASPLGNIQQRPWIDAMLAAEDTPAALLERAGAPRVEPRDCNAEWDAG